MNEYVLSILLGIVEGLTEFLPVSSTAHIRLTQAAVAGEASLHSGYWKLFAVVIQLPAILAVVVYFRARLIALVASFFAGGVSLKKCYTHPLALVGIATACTVVGVVGVPAVAAKLLGTEKALIKQNLESLYIMGGALVVGGIAMWVIDVIVKTGRTQSLEEMKPWQAAVVGCVQVLSAIFPGTSRSMSTIAGGQLSGLSRTTALEFSFFLAIPIMFLACGKDIWDSIKAPPGDPGYIEVTMDASRWIQIGLGSVTSFVVAFAVIAWFMGWVRKRGFVPFAIYRIIIGLVVLGWAWRSSHS